MRWKNENLANQGRLFEEAISEEWPDRPKKLTNERWSQANDYHRGRGASLDQEVEESMVSLGLRSHRNCFRIEI